MLRRRPWKRWLERALRVGLASACVGVYACSLAVDTDALQGGCPADSKPCDGKCVSRSDPDYGCSADGCRPCVIARATARCGESGLCVVATCQGDFADCNDDGDAPNSDGCEVDTAHDPEHCGGCKAAPCEVANGAPGCAGGQCSIGSCHPGFHDCDFVAKNGCESRVARCE
jgi:hypothetical protein